MNRLVFAFFCILLIALPCVPSAAAPQQESEDKKTPSYKTKGDFLRQMQLAAIESEGADWVHWGDRKDKFSNWTNHSNRLIPVYTFGITLKNYRGEKSPFRSAERVESIFGYQPASTLNSDAEYFDQTDIYRLQKDAIAAGKRNVILFVCDGMDWNTTQAASIYRNKKVLYTKDRGTGLHFLDYGVPKLSDYGYMVTSPFSGDTKLNVDNQTVISVGEPTGGYNADRGGQHPWSRPADPSYLLGKSASKGHAYTDSAASATSMTAGIKTYNGSINVSPTGEQVTTIVHELQDKGYLVGAVSSVPISHATPASTYAHNVTRNDYQDITRDLLGLPSIAHRNKPLKGLDVLIGCGWGKKSEEEEDQGANFVPGNRYLPAEDLKRIDIENGGKYFVVERESGKDGSEILARAATRAASDGNRLFGFFGGPGGHLPYRTADSKFDPTRGIDGVDVYEPRDISENPTLAEMTTAALDVLSSGSKEGKGFWLMVEAGDVDWANHNNNIDDAIGAVFDADDAFRAITQWVEKNSSWEATAVILTADHGHMMVLDRPNALATGKASKN